MGLSYSALQGNAFDSCSFRYLKYTAFNAFGFLDKPLTSEESS